MVPLKIDFVSDISCPWCAIGLAALDRALANLADEVSATVHTQPFELNPQMGPEGEDITEHLSRKYGSTPQEQAQIRERIRQRGVEVGFEFNPDGRGRIYNTFNAHRLLHWASETAPSHQMALKRAMLVACHRDRADMSSTEVLLNVAAQAGLDTEKARQVLDSDAFAKQVREQEAYYASHGIRSVPAVIINDRHLISGGQPVEVFEQALRQIASGQT